MSVATHTLPWINWQGNQLVQHTVQGSQGIQKPELHSDSDFRISAAITVRNINAKSVTLLHVFQYFNRSRHFIICFDDSCRVIRGQFKEIDGLFVLQIFSLVLHC